MACERYKSRLIEEALAPGGDPELTSHLPGCPECSSELSRQRELQNRIAGSIAAMVAAEPSPGLLNRVRQRVDVMDAIEAEASARRTVSMQWAMGGIAVAALASFAIWFAGRALLRQPVLGPQPGQTVGGLPTSQTSVQNQPAQTQPSPSSVQVAPVGAAAEKHFANRATSAQRKNLFPAHVTVARNAAPTAVVPADGAPKFTVIIPPGQREAVLRLVAAMQSGKVDVAGLLKESEQQQMAPLEIAPLKIIPLDEKKTTGQVDGKNK